MDQTERRLVPSTPAVATRVDPVAQYRGNESSRYAGKYSVKCDASNAILLDLIRILNKKKIKKSDRRQLRQSLRSLIKNLLERRRFVETSSKEYETCLALMREAMHRDSVERDAQTARIRQRQLLLSQNASSGSGSSSTSRNFTVATQQVEEALAVLQATAYGAPPDHPTSNSSVAMLHASTFAW